MTNGIPHICNKTTDIELIKNNITNMNENFKELKEMVKEGFKEVNSNLDKIKNEYATKEELNDVEIRVNKLDKILFGIGTWAILGLFGVTISLIVYIYITNLGK